MSTLAVPATSIDVLIVDDDARIRQLLRRVLERDGYCCAEAENGREAVEIASQWPPRLVILDLMMPQLDGFAAVRQLKSDPRTHGVHIYCLSGRRDQAARTEARHCGCEAYLTKPIRGTELLDIVSVAMQP